MLTELKNHGYFLLHECAAHGPEAVEAWLTSAGLPAVWIKYKGSLQQAKISWFLVPRTPETLLLSEAICSHWTHNRHLCFVLAVRVYSSQKPKYHLTCEECLACCQFSLRLDLKTNQELQFVLVFSCSPLSFIHVSIRAAQYDQKCYQYKVLHVSWYW